MKRKSSLIVFVIALAAALFACANVAVAREPVTLGEAVAQATPRDPAQPNATIHFAKPGGATTGACDSWANACDLQYAIGHNPDDIEIWLARGVYTPGTNITSRFKFTGGHPQALYGGFAMTETSREQRNWRANLTVLSGDLDGDDETDANGVVTEVSGIMGDNAYHVLYASGTDTTTVLDGLVVTGGDARDDDGNGGGLFADGEACLTLRNTTFEGNRATGDGGGMYASFDLDSGSLTLDNVAFINNETTSSCGGLAVTRVGLMNNVLFSGNRAYQDGGGLCLLRPITVNNALFSGNLAGGYGGALRSSAGDALVNATFAGNRAWRGGALYFSGGHHTLTNSILWGNSAERGPQIYTATNASLSITYGDIQGGFAGVGNLDVDPQFVAPVDAAAAPTAAGDYHLQLTSPLIDAGNNFSITTDTDLVGKVRRANIVGVLDTGFGTPPIVDMGAYEVHWPTALAGVPQSVKAGTLVVLDGSASFDSGDNLPLSYGWAQSGGAPGVVLSSAVISRPTFVAPFLASPTLLAFTLIVTNSIGQVSWPDQVAITVNPIGANLGLSLTDNKSYIFPGDLITYTLVVTNAGPDAANGALITDTLPAIISDVAWMCVASSGSCSTPSGTANINTLVNLNAGGAITFTISGRLALGASGTLVNTAGVAHFADPNSDNNSATDSDLVLHIKVYLPLVIR